MAVTRADLDDEFDEDEFVDEFGADESTAPWHNSTRAVVGASAAGIAVIGVLIAAVMLVSGGDDPADGPVNFVDPSFSETAVASSATTTTPTITSTPQVSTTEINAPTGPSSTTSGTSGTVGHQRQQQREQRRSDIHPATAARRRRRHRRPHVANQAPPERDTHAGSRLIGASAYYRSPWRDTDLPTTRTTTRTASPPPTRPTTVTRPATATTHRRPVATASRESRPSPRHPGTANPPR